MGVSSSSVLALHVARLHISLLLKTRLEFAEFLVDAASGPGGLAVHRRAELRTDHHKVQPASHQPYRTISAC
eukprot:2672134-Pleurochrysis_carterae.AAC.3